MFQWLIELLQEFQKQGPLEQFTYVFAALSAVVTAALTYRSLVRRGFAETQEKCEKLTAEIGANQVRIKRRDVQIAEHERTIAALRARVPEFQLELADKERLEGNETKTIRILTDLLADIRPAVSSCCFQLAECHLGMFIDDAATPHLHTAGRLARIAALLDPERHDARELLTEIEAILGDSDSRLGDYPTSDAHWDIALDYVGGPRTGHGAALLEELIERAHALYQEGQYYTSAIFFRRTVFLATEQLGPDHPSTLATRHNLAALYQNLGRHREAETLFNRSSPSGSSSLARPPVHAGNAAPSGHALRDMGRDQEAETLFNEVLAKRETARPRPPVRWQRATIWPGSTGTWADTGRPRRSSRRSSPSRSSSSAPTTRPRWQRATIGRALPGHGPAQGGRDALQRVLAKREQQLGPDHPDTLKTRHNLAMIYRQIGRHQEAETLFNEVLAKREQKLGPDHPDTLTARHNLAVLYRDMGRHQKAETLFNEVLAKQEQQLGPDHPDTLATRHSLAALYRQIGRHQEAETLFNEVLAKQEQQLGPDHPDTLTARAALEKLRAGRGELPDERALPEAETPDLRPGMVTRLFEVEAPLVGQLAEEPAPGGPEGPPPAAR